MMTKQLTGGAILAALLLVGTLATTADAQQAQPPALTEAGQKLEAGYAAQIQTLKAEIEKALPQINEQNKAAFIEACKAAKDAPDKAQEKTAPAAAALNLTPLLADSKLDPKLVKFVVLNSATPRGLAEFAQQGAEQAALVEKLLADTELGAPAFDGAMAGFFVTIEQTYFVIGIVSLNFVGDEGPENPVGAHLQLV